MTKRNNLLDTVEAKVSEQLAIKQGVLSQIDDRLAVVRDMALGISEQAGSKDATTSDAIRLIMQARITGLLSKDEVSERLGKTFGFKVSKTTGKISKTPDGDGEHIRKRIVRLYGAWATIYKPSEAGDYFDLFIAAPKDSPEFAELVRIADAIHNNEEYTPFLAYNEIGEAKKALEGARPKSCFDPAKVLAMAKDLATPEAEAFIAKSPQLALAYATLRQVMNGWQASATVKQATGAELKAVVNQ